MRFMNAVVLSVLALSCVVTDAWASEPMAFSRDHPAGYPSLLLSWGEQYGSVFSIGPEVERMPLTEDWISANIRKIAADEVTFYLGQLRYVSYLNNLCGGTECTVTANIKAYIPKPDRKDDDSLIVRMTLNGSSSYMESYMFQDIAGGWHVLSRGESGWINKCGTPEAPDFKGIMDAALYLVWKGKHRVH